MSSSRTNQNTSLQLNPKHYTALIFNYRNRCLHVTFIKDDSWWGLSKQVDSLCPLYGIVTTSKPIASGIAKTKDTTQIKTISIAVHFGTPIPLIRLHEATARYLNIKKRSWSV